MKLLNLIFVSAAITFTFYFGNVKSETKTKDDVIKDGDITVVKAAEMIVKNSDNNEFLILDVRTPEEFINGRIKNAILVNYRSADFKSRVNKFDIKKDVLVYCKKGGRSAAAKLVMEQLGFVKVYNMLGGITEWEKKGYNLVE